MWTKTPFFIKILPHTVYRTSVCFMNDVAPIGLPFNDTAVGQTMYWQHWE